MSPHSPDPAEAWSHVITLAAGLAHEIKNPLSTISLNLQLLQEDWQGPETPRQRRTLKRLETLQRETSRLAGLLEDFLRYARTQHIEPEPCRLNDIVQEMLDFFAPQAARCGIDIRTRLAPDLPVVHADPKLLKQAILNLVVNAREAMPDGGELLVQTARHGDQLQIDVTDTGVGIPDHHLGKIFDLYFSTREGGSGLGLAATRRILELHGGTIDVESEVHKGTHFTIRLPIAPAAHATESQEGPS
jgi:two-component system sensor histidine kinase HydH